MKRQRILLMAPAGDDRQPALQLPPSFDSAPHPLCSSTDDRRDGTCIAGLDLLAHVEMNPYIAGVRQVIISVVVLLLLAGNVAVAVHGHDIAAGGGDAQLTTQDGSGSGPNFPLACEICSHGLSDALRAAAMTPTVLFTIHRLALPLNPPTRGSWREWPADRPPKSAIPD